MTLFVFLSHVSVIFFTLGDLWQGFGSIPAALICYDGSCEKLLERWIAAPKKTEKMIDRRINIINSISIFIIIDHFTT
jgi:hypothetical protein